MIYLARHGQTDWNIEHRIQGHLDISLNETGKKEAAICAKELSSVRIDKIISSDLSRAKETADIINKMFSAPISFDARLREVNCGDLQGMLSKDIPDETWDIFNHEPHKIHAESLADVYNRVKSFFEQITDTNQNILIITHGGVIRMTMYLSQHPHSFDQNEFEKTALHFKINNTEIFQWNTLTPMCSLSQNDVVSEKLEF